jgi:hypothetical protein
MLRDGLLDFRQSRRRSENDTHFIARKTAFLLADCRLSLRESSVARGGCGTRVQASHDCGLPHYEKQSCTTRCFRGAKGDNLAKFFLPIFARPIQIAQLSRPPLSRIEKFFNPS